MRINLQTQGFDVTPTIRAHVNRQIDFNLSNFEQHVQRVDVYLKDINGPKGGEDMKALMRVKLRSCQPVKVESTREDLYAAVALAARHAKRSVKRSLSKDRHMEKLAIREIRRRPQL